MRPSRILLLSLLLLGVSLALPSGSGRSQAAQKGEAAPDRQNTGSGSGAQPGLFDANPNHPWNRVHRCLMQRRAANGFEYGDEALDPLLWDATRFLREGESNRRALDCLDEFLRSHAERQITDPIKRAILQRDLWAVFDWSATQLNWERAQEARRDRFGDHRAQLAELETRIAEVLRRIALSDVELRALPDTYQEAVNAGVFAKSYDPENSERPFLPPELFQRDGPWVCLGSRGLLGPVAITHVGAVSGRSRFLVFVRLPGGRKATLEYLDKLWEFPRPLQVPNERGQCCVLNLDVPQFPAGTQVALVRQMVLFDKSGKLAATAATESVQLRVYRMVSAGSPYPNYINGPASRDQDVFEFQLDRRKLFAGEAGGLRAVAPDDKEFFTFMTHGDDPFEFANRQSGEPEKHRGVILKRCVACHADAGIHSLASRLRIVRPNGRPSELEGTREYGPMYWETVNTLEWEQERYSWGLLNGYWLASGK